MIALIWTIRKIVHMIKLFKYFTIIYIDHGINSTIAIETRFNIININELNIKLIRISTYFSQFRLEIRHRIEKSNVISDALSRLSCKKSKIESTLNVNVKNSETNQMYTHEISLIEMILKFRKTFVDNYAKNFVWKNIKFMLTKLKKRAQMKNLSNKIEIDFTIKKNLIYHINEKRIKLCVPILCERTIFKLIHDHNNHAKHYRTYQRFVNSVYMSKMSRKTCQYIKHCSSCELNQTKKHATYEKLMFISVSTISFKIIAIDFVMTLSETYNLILTITCKFFKKISLISGMFTWKINE